MSNFEGITNIQGKRQYLWLLSIMIIGFLIRLWLLDKRWINPDEGAHIMDGRLVLDGLVPEVDYHSRQVVYVYIIALILKVFGNSYLNVRFLPLFSTVAISLLVFLIAKKLFNEKIALLASAIYTFLPLSILESTIVKTEPLVTLFSCVGIYFAISGVASDGKAGLLLFLSGVFLSLAYYVRQSSLAIPVALFLFFTIIYWQRFKLLFRNYGIFMCGYGLVCVIVFVYFSQFMTLSHFWNSTMNPLDIILKSLQNIFSPFMPHPGAAPDNHLTPMRGFVLWNLTMSYINLTLFTHSFLLVGVLFSMCFLAYSLKFKRGDDGSKKVFHSFSLLYSWLFTLAAFYLYYMFQKSFRIQYFGEFLPPLTIILAFVINLFASSPELEKSLGRNIAMMASILLVVFVFQMWAPDLKIKSMTYVLISTVALAFFYFPMRVRVQRWFVALTAIIIMSGALFKLVSLAPAFTKGLVYSILLILVYLTIFAAGGVNLRRDFRTALGFTATSILVSSLVMSFAASGYSMGLAFDSPWSPKTVEITSDFIEKNSNEGDEVMSGGVIWELKSNRRPFMNQSHPLGYLSGISEEEAKKIEWHLANHPPKFIVLDGYTEKTYLKYINGLQAMMKEKYEIKKVVDGSGSPVSIYELKGIPSQSTSNQLIQ